MQLVVNFLISIALITGTLFFISWVIECVIFGRTLREILDILRTKCYKIVECVYRISNRRKRCG